MFRRNEGEDRHERPDREHRDRDRDRDRPIEAREVRMRDEPGAEVTVVGQGARLEGTIVSAGSLRIDGQVKGKISAEGDVSLSPQSQVEADIQAQSVTVAGKYRGNVVVRNRAELARGGRVDGNITSKALIVAEGAVFNGQSIMDQSGAQGQRSAEAGRAQQGGEGRRVAAPPEPERTPAG
jgi:cytoskeletal protein CcmA (bactofilin family)